MQKKLFIFILICSVQAGVSSLSARLTDRDQGAQANTSTTSNRGDSRVRETVTITIDGPISHKRQIRIRSTNKGCRVDATASKIFHDSKERGSNQAKIWASATERVQAGGGHCHQGEVVTGDVNGGDVVTITHNGPVLHRSHASNLSGS